MEPTFPLLRLPENVIIEVIKNLAIDPLFEFSLISTKTRNIATSLELTAQAVCITISRDVGVTVYSRYFNMERTFYNNSVDQDALIHLDSNQLISAHYLDIYDRRTVRSSTSLLSFNNWLDHIKTVFCYNEPPNVVIWDGNERFEMESLKNSIQCANNLYLTGANTKFRSRELLEHFKNPNKLSLARNPFEKACEVQKFFIQNFKSIGFYDDFSLDDMLLVNSERVIFSRSISQKQFNQFLKHWIRGSNPKLKHMDLSIDKIVSVNGEIYLKGINWIKISEESKEEIRQRHIIYNDEMIEIRRNDGTSAVIVPYRLETLISVRFYFLY